MLLADLSCGGCHLVWSVFRVQEDSGLHGPEGLGHEHHQHTRHGATVRDASAVLLLQSVVHVEE